MLKNLYYAKARKGDDLGYKQIDTLTIFMNRDLLRAMVADPTLYKICLYPLSEKKKEEKKEMLMCINSKRFNFARLCRTAANT